MIRIVWNNLTPPGFSQTDIVDFLITPAVFHNPELRKKIDSSSFYRRKCKCDGKDMELTFPEDLLRNKASRTRLLSYQPESGGINERMLEILLLKTENNGKPYQMRTFPIRLAFMQQWQKIMTPFDPADLKGDPERQKYVCKGGFYFMKEGDQLRRLLSAEEVSSFKEYLQLFWQEHASETAFQTFIDNWKGSTEKKSVSRQISDVPVAFSHNDHGFDLLSLLASIDIASDADALLLERLATMSVIACVWYIWEAAAESPDDAFKTSRELAKQAEYREQLLRLSQMIFPAGSMLPFVQNHIQENPNADASDSDDTQLAAQKLAEVQALIGAKQYAEAGALCEQIFNIHKHASDYVLGTALAHLVECCENGYKKPSKFRTIDDIKKEAINYGCLYISKKRNDIKIVPEHAKTNCEGTYTLNCENAISRHILDTAPTSWDPVVSVTPASTITPKKPQRILLINDDYDVNTQDAIDILHAIKKNVESGSSRMSDWEKLELYVRCNESEITPLLDTALSYFTEDFSRGSDEKATTIHVYLIDEAKRSVDYLLAKHPHFYPLSFLHGDSLVDKSINFVIVSDNPNSDYIKWLIKEAFWTLPRYDHNIHTKITVISPDAAEIGYAVLSDCQGLEDFSVINGIRVGDGNLVEIKDILFPTIEYKTTSFADRSLHSQLKNIFSAKDTCLYFAIDAKDDLTGIQLGMAIRELAIRNAVSSGRINSYSKKNYTIAVRCANPDYAGLTQELIIPKEEEHANQWFNDYNFITWGSIDDIYAWDQLDGGILEKASQCVHLQYCGSAFDSDSCAKDLESYYKRLYNHDSSFSAAVSLPYRLYEAGVTPSAWFIQNPDAWWSADVRSELAFDYQQTLYPNGKLDEELMDRLVRYEHIRWCCYMLTRGWLPVSGYKAVQYMIAGSSRHNLQIAKLHPCICSWDDLEDLQRELSYAATRSLSIAELEAEEAEGRVPTLDKRFAKFYTSGNDFTYFQKLDTENIAHTADILQIKWNLLAN